MLKRILRKINNIFPRLQEIIPIPLRRFFNPALTRYVTVDIDPAKRIWGGHEHRIAPIQKIHEHVPSHCVDVVILSGVFGYGVDDEHEMNRAVESVHKILKSTGFLILGWDMGLTQDPLTLEAFKRLFSHESVLDLPARKTFEDHNHLFDNFKPI